MAQQFGACSSGEPQFDAKNPHEAAYLLPVTPAPEVFDTSVGTCKHVHTPTANTYTI